MARTSMDAVNNVPRTPPGRYDPTPRSRRGSAFPGPQRAPLPTRLPPRRVAEDERDVDPDTGPGQRGAAGTQGGAGGHHIVDQEPGGPPRGEGPGTHASQA